MTDVDFHRVLSQLKDMDFKGRISPYLTNEPLLDPRIYGFMRDIRNRFPHNVIFINTNGDALKSLEVWKDLIESGVDAVHLNCYDGKEEWLRLRASLSTLAQLFPQVQLHEHGTLRLLPKPTGKCHIKAVWIPTAAPGFWNRGGHVKGVTPRGKRANGRTCGFPYTQMYINYQGKAVLCCSDWKSEVIMGDVHQTTLKDIWDGEQYRWYRRMLADGRSQELPLCQNCNRIVHEQDSVPL